MKRVVVTGGSGFVGRQCVELLIERGFEVHVFSTQNREDSRVCWHIVDLMNADQSSEAIRTIEPSHLLHLAWVTRPGAYSSTAENLDWVISSLHLMRQFHAAGGQRVVMTGTCAEYDWSDGFCSEATTPLMPTTYYGRCKLLLQSALADYSRHSGLSSAWGRLFFIYGPHAHPARMPATIITSLLQNQPALCSQGEQIRDFLYVRDVAGALIALLDSDIQGPINIASGHPITIREIALQIADRLDRRHLLRLGAIPQAAGDPPRVVADVHRLTTELGWRPSLSLATGLEQTLQWHQG